MTHRECPPTEIIDLYRTKSHNISFHTQSCSALYSNLRILHSLHAWVVLLGELCAHKIL